MSFSVSMSVENVEFTTDGLFFTLGKIMPPLRDSGLADVVVVVAADDATLAVETPVLPAKLAAICAAVTVYEVRVG